jgi:hypothetical protein
MNDSIGYVVIHVVWRLISMQDTTKYWSWGIFWKAFLIHAGLIFIVLDLTLMSIIFVQSYL